MTLLVFTQKTPKYPFASLNEHFFYKTFKKVGLNLFSSKFFEIPSKIHSANIDQNLDEFCPKNGHAESRPNLGKNWHKKKINFERNFGLILAGKKITNLNL